MMPAITSYHEPTSTQSPPPAPSKWGPYSGAGDFGANMVIILTILFCALFLALALNAIIRYLLCPTLRLPARSGTHHPSSPDTKKSPMPDEGPNFDSLPAQIFSAAAAGAEAECAICLAEFADGDRVRVLPACNHGFHVACVERWLRSKGSCPTCRQVAVGPAAV